MKQIYDLMLHHSSFKIVRSTRLKVDHNLVAKKGTKLADVKEIFSHPQAISQCSAYLEKLGKGVKITPVKTPPPPPPPWPSLTGPTWPPSAPTAASPSTAWAPGRRHSGPQQQLHPLHLYLQKSGDLPRGGQDLSHGGPAPPARLPVSDPGPVLHHGLNLIKLESRPLPDREFEFMFYFDLETSVYSDEFIRMVDDLSAICEEFQYLGSYSEVI